MSKIGSSSGEPRDALTKKISSLEQELANTRALMQSLDSIRMEIMTMKGPKDVLAVSAAIKRELERHGVPFKYCGVNIVDKTLTPHDVLVYNFLEEKPWTDHAPLMARDIILDIWRGGKTAYRPDLSLEDSLGESPNLLTLFSGVVRSVVDVPFSHGTLAMSSESPNAFSEQHIDLLEKMAVVLSEGFSRRDDLTELETRARTLEQEIAEREKAQEALATSEKLYHTTIDAMSDIIHVMDGDNRILMHNKELERWHEKLGLPLEIDGKLYTELYSFHNDGVPEEYEKVRETGKPMITEETTTFAGDSLITETIKIPIKENGHTKNILTIIRDITERKTTEYRLMESEEKFRSLAQNAPVGIIRIDTTGNITEINPKLIDILGSPSLSKTKTFNIFSFPLLNKAGISEDFRLCMDEDRVIVAARPYTSFWNNQLYLRYTIAPLYDENSIILGVQGIVEDISEQKQLEEQMRIRQTMDSLGVLAGGIAHDFNNILAGIMGNLDLVMMETPDVSPDNREHLEEAYDTCLKAAKLVKDFQALTARAMSDITTIDLYVVVHDVFTILQRTTDRLIEKKIQFEKNRFFVKGHPGQLHQVFLNLGTNAAQAIAAKENDQGGTITVNAAEAEDLPSAPKIDPNLTYIHVTFSDTGVGMNEETRLRAFEPLFTTKLRGAQKGQGLGLSMVYSIITRNHNGHVEIETKEGAGATFHLYLPRSAEQPHEEASYVYSNETQAGHETVLVVEDETSVRNLTERALKKFGYQVIIAVDGIEGLDMFSEHRENIDLVLLDLTLPRMSGRMLLGRIRDMKPETPVIITTGHSPEEMKDKHCATEIILKPYKLTELTHMIRRALDKNT